MILGIGEVVHLRNGGQFDWVCVDQSEGRTTFVPLDRAHPLTWQQSPWIMSVADCKLDTTVTPCKLGCTRNERRML
jgi:hypothetical protein